MNDISKDYFNWLCKLIDHEGRVRVYKKTLALLNDLDFIFTIPKDGNRYEDGIDLRALAVRMEDHIMYDPDKGNQQSHWFWVMFDNLGLQPMTNSRFEEHRADIYDIVDRLNYREYEPDGTGGLFVNKKKKKNMLEEEIWYQMMEYLKELE